MAADETVQMDYAAVSYASEEILKNMGLAAKGDVLALKRFADANLSGNNYDQDKEREQRKRKLYDIIQKKDKRKPQIKESPQHNSRNKTRHFKLGWLHLDEMKKKYVSVRYPRGGGSRDVDLPGNSTKDEIIKYAKTLFFPENESVFGKDYEMTFDLGNFKEQMIADIKDEANNVVPFTLEMYFKVHKLSRVRLYLMSKLLSSVQSDDEDLEDEEDEKDDVEDKEDDGEDDKVDVGDEGGVEIEQYMIDDEDLPPISAIIGSSSERDALKAMQDKEYSESLQADQEKERQRNKDSVNKEKEEERLQSLMLAKKRRVPNEPLNNENHVLVVVRHRTIGVIRRRFYVTEGMTSIYDWVGSLATNPEHFHLSTHPGNYLAPDEPVTVTQGYVLHMTASEEPIPLSKDIQDQDVTFMGYGPAQSEELNVDETLSDQESDSFHIEPVSAEVPSQLLIEDGGETNLTLPPQTTDNAAPGRRFREMVNMTDSQNEQEEDEVDEDLNFKKVKVRRNHIVHDVLNLYRDDTFPDHKLNVTFEDEVGMDLGGLTEDMFSSFWEEAFQTFFDGDGVVKVPFVPPQKMVKSKDDMKMLGRILEHSWALTRKLPIQFCEASLIALIHGEEMVTNETLHRSFLWYVSQLEKDVLESFLSDEKPDAFQNECLLSLYQRFGMQCTPGATNVQVKEHIIAMAQSEFIFKPLCLLTWMRDGINRKRLNKFKQSLPVQAIGALYSQLSPTTRKTIESLQPESSDLKPEQQRVYNFLLRYIGNMDREQLLRFLRFVTGATCAPQKPIKVFFNGATGMNRVPNASTCSSTLTIPTTYDRMSEFKNEFDIILMSRESFTMSLT
ncbi:hypothetical protein QZH41_003617 [Actinostola sp. cb2023]|nr:hypothetical protein QZH41_003617 [Actinostola sp. cb2023]